MIWNNPQPWAPPVYVPILPPPYAFGLPGKFREYRRNQDIAIVRGVESKARFLAQCAPVGFGKSMNAILQAVLGGLKCVVLTATKGLQDQYLREFGEMGLVDQRGRDNYPCPIDPSKYTCDEGPCMGGSRCSLKFLGKCPYTESVKAFNSSRLAVTNYAWWLAVGQGGYIDAPDLLVCDEAHDAPHQLEAALELFLSDSEIRNILRTPIPASPTDEYFVDGAWASWARGCASVLGAQIDDRETEAKTTGGGMTQDTYRELKRLKRLLGKLKLLGQAGQSCWWVWERRNHGWQFNPLYPAQYAENWLFRGVGKVLLTSGTLTPKTCETLGVPQSQCDYQDYPSPFDPRRAPIYRYTTGVRWDKSTSYENQRYLVTLMDNVMRGRSDRKGIIHSVSYDRQQTIYGASQMAGIMYGNARAKQRGETRAQRSVIDHTSSAAVVEAFKRAAPPAVLVSPTVTTGWDFPLSQCEYQIICKLPFPDASSRIMKARAKVDPEYAAHLCAVELQQMCGRGMRSPEDQCETFIMDDHSKWFLGKNRHLFNSSFWQFVRSCESPPPAPPRLQGQG